MRLARKLSKFLIRLCLHKVKLMMMTMRLLEKLNTYFILKVNVIHERARFFLRTQKHDESVEEYIRSLYETCQFGLVKIENIRDRLVTGIMDKELSEKLQLTADLMLDRAVEILRQSEQIKGQIRQ